MPSKKFLEMKRVKVHDPKVLRFKNMLYHKNKINWSEDVLHDKAYEHREGVWDSVDVLL